MANGSQALDALGALADPTRRRIYERLLPIINFENRQCGWRSCKVVMKEGGVIRSEAVRHPTRPLHPETRAQLLELARDVEPLALRWGL